jgi:CheY-like chemotaxis protein
VILLAGPASAAETPSREAVRAEGAERAATLLSEGEVSVLVLDLSMDGAAGLFRRLRAGDLGAPDRPAVLLADGEPEIEVRSFDAVLRKPVSAEALAAALDRAETVVAYRNAVRDLYERCRDRAASGAADPLAESAALSDTRDAADEALAALDDPAVVADLLGE